MNTVIMSSGLRPGNNQSSEYGLSRLLKILAMVAIFAFIGWWVIFELIGYIPGEKVVTSAEQFQSGPVKNYYRQIPSPANIIQNPDSQEYERQANPAYDTDILRANRYYEIKPENGNIPATNLFSQTTEIPTTYMLNIINKVQAQDPDFTISSLDPALKTWLSNYQTAPNDLSKKSNKYILANLNKLTPADLAEIPELAALFSTVRFYLVTKINMAVLDAKLSSPSHPFQPFEIINSRNTNIRAANPDNLADGLVLIADMILYRSAKTHTFNIQATVNLKPTTLLTGLHGHTEEITLIGSTIAGETSLNPLEPSPFSGEFPDSAPVSKGGPASRFFGPGVADIALGDYSAGSVELDKNLAEYERRKAANPDKCGPDSPTAQGFRFMLYENSRASLPRNLRQPKYDNGDWTNTDPAIEDKVRRYLEVGCGRCFGVNPATNEIIELPKYSDDKVACESAHMELDGQVGVWDTPCKADTDCPYYQANKNYPNTFGKCIKATGTCEMPVGGIRMGYKLEHKRSEPRCNNCNKIPGYDVKTERDEICCELQANKLDDLGLNSPDYRFAGDLFERQKPDNRRALESLGLNP